MQRILALFLVFAMLLSGASADSLSFDSMTAACSHVRQTAQSGATTITLLLTQRAVSGRDTAEIRDVLTDVLEYCQSYDIRFSDTAAGLEITITCEPRPALKMLHAWETGDYSSLSEEESACLTQAMAVADACRAHGQTGLAIELAIYEYICRHVSYAHDAVAQGTSSAAYRRASTCLGALIDGTAQCQGYAEAFWLISTLSGLDVETQYGWGGGDSTVKHAWNTIRLGQYTYIVDVCWGDVAGDSFEAQTPDYRYFNVALDRMPEGRCWHAEAQVSSISPATAPAHSAFAGLTGDAATLSTLDEAVQFAIMRHHDGADYAHIFIPGQRVTVSQAQDAMLQAIRSAGIDTKWGRLAHEFAGGTYLIIRWVYN